MAERGGIKAAFFDFMGTCLDWCTSVADGMPHAIPEAQRREFALNWRVAYFRENEQRLDAGLPTEDIDETLTRTLEQMLLDSDLAAHFTAEVRQSVIRSWHHQIAWPDVAPALQQLQDDGLEIFVHANGTTRLQLDLMRSSGLRFHLAMSSQMLGQIKPAPEPYLKALSLIKRRPKEVVMVAAHVADLRGAKNVGLPTIYIRRSTDDIHEDLSQVDQEFDVVLDDMSRLAEVIRKL